MKHISEYITIVIEDLEVKAKRHANNNGHVLEFKRDKVKRQAR